MSPLLNSVPSLRLSRLLNQVDVHHQRLPGEGGGTVFYCTRIHERGFTAAPDAGWKPLRVYLNLIVAVALPALADATGVKPVAVASIPPTMTSPVLALTVNPPAVI